MPNCETQAGHTPPARADDSRRLRTTYDATVKWSSTGSPWQSMDRRGRRRPAPSQPTARSTRRSDECRGRRAGGEPLGGPGGRRRRGPSAAAALPHHWPGRAGDSRIGRAATTQLWSHSVKDSRRREGVGSRSLAAGLTRAWVRLYTRGLPARKSARHGSPSSRSDLWEHERLADDRRPSDPARISSEIVVHGSLAGLAADLSWRTRAMERATPTSQHVHLEVER